MDIDIDDIVDQLVDAYSKKFEKDFYRISNQVNDIYFNDANKLYDSFIRQYYYQYETEFYIRHWEKAPGTRKGTNLYYGNQMKIHRGQNPYFEINFDSSRMADDYRHDSAEDVLTEVIYGIRGVPPYWTRPWQGKYKSRYFNFSGTMHDAFKTYIDTYEDRMVPVFMRRWKKAGWQ